MHTFIHIHVLKHKIKYLGLHNMSQDTIDYGKKEPLISALKKEN